MNWVLLVTGLLVGSLSGVVGIGGGILFVPALIWLTGMSQHRAQGTSIAALLAPVGLLAFWQYYRAGNVDLRAAALLGLGFFFGGFLGAGGAQLLPDLWLRRIFAIVLVAVGLKIWFTK